MLILKNGKKTIDGTIRRVRGTLNQADDANPEVFFRVRATKRNAMIGAFAYLYTVSLKNRYPPAKRLKGRYWRLMAGGLYFFVFFFRPIFMSFQGGPTRSAGLNPDFLPLIEFGGALMVVLLVAQAWIIPSKRVALDFTEAEIFFLFPAPVSRRALIHFKLLKSQLAILMVAVLMAAFSRRSPGQGLFWMHGIG